MASEQCVLDYVSRALWDVHPTRTDIRAQQLALALGYPLSWRVVRTIEDAPVLLKNVEKAVVSSDIVNVDSQEDAETVTAEGKEADKEAENDPTKVDTVKQEGPAEAITASRPTTTTTAATNPPVIIARKCIVDRIYAGKPGTGCDMWFHHGAAMAAAAEWDPESSTPFDCGGGHLLPRLPLYSKGDKVQVLYEGKWWDATVHRRKGDRTGYKYGVHYSADGTKQSGVDESVIRFRPQVDNPKLVAQRLGLDGWDAYANAHNKYKIVAPNGDVYHGKKQALEAYARYHAKDGSGGKDVGDPPWRGVGNDYVGRHVVHTVEHKASARRTVSIDQYGTVTGWISETDVDRAGQPGFISEKTGKPARLYHVKFEEVPYHQYASLLLDAVDLEEHELEQCLVEEDPTIKEPSKKKVKT
jgi:hypothetical protein